MEIKSDYRQEGYHKGFTDGRRTGGKVNNTYVDNYLSYETQNLSTKDALEFIKAWHEGFADGVIGEIGKMVQQEGLLEGHINEKFQWLLICLTLSSRKDLSIAPCFIGGFHFICRAAMTAF